MSLISPLPHPHQSDTISALSFLLRLSSMPLLQHLSRLPDLLFLLTFLKSCPSRQTKTILAFHTTNPTPPYLRDSLVEDLPQADPEYILSPIYDEPTNPAIDSCQSHAICPIQNTHPDPRRSSRQRSYPAALLQDFVLFS